MSGVTLPMKVTGMNKYGDTTQVSFGHVKPEPGTTPEEKQTAYEAAEKAPVVDCSLGITFNNKASEQALKDLERVFRSDMEVNVTFTEAPKKAKSKAEEKADEDAAKKEEAAKKPAAAGAGK